MTNFTPLWIIFGGVGLAVAVWPEDRARHRLRRVRGYAVGRGATPDNASLAAFSAMMRSRWQLLIPLLLAIPFVIGAVPTTALLTCAYTAVFVARSIRGRRRRKAESEQLVRFAEGVVSELKVGASSAGALNSALQEAEHRARFGLPWTQLLDTSNAHNPDLVRLARVWKAAEHFGLPMAEIIDNVRADLQARLAHRSRTSAALAGPRMTIAILASLPLFGLVMGQAFGAHPFEFLASGGIGSIVLVIGIGIACAGVVWSTHILQKAEGI